MHPILLSTTALFSHLLLDIPSGLFSTGYFLIKCRFFQVFKPFKYSLTIQPIRMTSEASSAGTRVAVTGWGNLASGGTSPLELQKVQLNIIDFNKCYDLYRMYKLVTPRMICAGAPEGEKDSCQGDSGGPLVSKGQLVGIVSWGKGCGHGSFPGVYADVYDLKKWVTCVTGVS